MFIEVRYKYEVYIKMVSPDNYFGDFVWKDGIMKEI